MSAFCSCVCFCAFTFARLCCFSLADNEYGNRYSNSESNKANDNPNPSVRRITRRNRESGGCVTACRADGKCVLALRKCLKIACLELNDGTAFAPFIIFGSDGLSVHKYLNKVGECRVGAEGQSVFIAFPPLTVRSVKNRRRKLLCNGVLGADLLLPVCVGKKLSACGTTPVRSSSRACRRCRYRIYRFQPGVMVCIRFAVFFMTDFTLRLIGAGCRAALMSVRMDDRAGGELFSATLAIRVTGITVFDATLRLGVPNFRTAYMICGAEFTISTAADFANRLLAAGSPCRRYDLLLYLSHHSVSICSSGVFHRAVQL